MGLLEALDGDESTDLVHGAFPLDLFDEVDRLLLGDAVVLMNSAVADSVQGVGFPALKEVMAKVIAAKVPIYI